MELRQHWVVGKVSTAQIQEVYGKDLASQLMLREASQQTKGNPGVKEDDDRDKACEK